MADLARAIANLIEAAKKTLKANAMKRVVTKLEKAMGKAFKRQGTLYARRFASLKNGWPVMEEAIRLQESLGDEAAFLFGDIEDDTLDLFLLPLQAAIQAMLQAGALSLLADLGLDLAFSLKNPRATAYLAEHGADLVKMIDETTRGDIKHIVEYGVDNGWSYTKTAAAIQAEFKDYYTGDSYWNFDAPRAQAHIDSRAHLIAVQESAQAYETGNYIVVEDLQTAGIEIEKSWSTMQDERVSEICLGNEADGWIPADQPHSSGHMHPTGHVACRCDELYRMKP